MSMTEVVEESLKADARFRHLTVMPDRKNEEIRLVMARIAKKRESGSIGIIDVDGANYD